MCCFSVMTPVGLLGGFLAKKVHVARTNIFARMLDARYQGLAYGMDLDSGFELAMVLPLPVVPDAGEDAVSFIDLSLTPQMFSELAALFDDEPARAKGGLPSLGAARQLVVHEVGAFIASYVPKRADFARLDARFRLPTVLFDAVPHYANYGFAVFQLKPGKVTVHPMALTFPTCVPEKLFFPTVHIHDGRFHETAKFDHTLYYQHPRALRSQTVFSQPFAGDTVSGSLPLKSYAGLVDESRPIVRRTLRGRLPNADLWIGTV